MKAAIAATLMAMAISLPAQADTEDAIIGAGAAVATTATAAALATPAVVAHSSGMAIMYSGAGYVAGTIGMAAGTVALLPAIAIGGATIAAGALIYKYSDEIGGLLGSGDEDDRARLSARVTCAYGPGPTPRSCKQIGSE